MATTVFNPDAYLARIHQQGTISGKETGLAELHHGQLCNIPFENFEVLLHGGISLEPHKIIEKLVYGRRGGYCFELNGLFLIALQAFGFYARPLLARVHRDGMVMGRGHQISLVELQDRQWLCDVGFGGPHLPFPLPLELNRVESVNGESFRLVEAAPYGIMLQLNEKDVWQDLYSFDLDHVCPGDIKYANHYTSTHPDSFFTCSRVAAIALPEGRFSLYNHTLRQKERGVEQVREVAPGSDYMKVLQEYFGIELGIPYAALPPIGAKGGARQKCIGF